jgi:hypothetical protein
LNLAGVGEQSGYASQLGNTPKVANIVTVLIEQCDKLQQRLELDKLLPPSSGISKLYGLINSYD